MAKISELSDGGSLLPTDFLIAVRSGGNVKVQADTINVDQIDLGDNEKIRLGNSQDLQIYHNGSTQDKIESSSAFLILEGSNIILRNNGGTEDYAKFFGNGAVELYSDNSKKLATTSSGIDVTGTVTADGLTVDGDVTVTGASAISLSSTQHITYQTTSTNATAGDHIFKSYNTEIMRIDGNNNRVGIGTSLCGAPLSFADSAALKIQFNGNAANYYGISKLAASGGGDGDLTFTAGQTSAGNFTFDSGGSERMRINADGSTSIKANAGSLSHAFSYNENGGEISLYDDGGSQATLIDQSNNSTRVLELINGSNLAIGLGASNTTGNVIFYGAGLSEAARFDASGNLAKNGNGNIQVGGYNTGTDYGLILTPADTATYWHIYNDSGGHLAFGHSSTIGSTEKVRISAAGDLLVGKSNATATDLGAQIESDGQIKTTSNGQSSLTLNRKTSDGSIAIFQKDGTTQGSIGTEVADTTLQADLYLHARSTAGGSALNESRLWLLGGDSGIVLDGYTNAILPTDENSYEDDRTNLGSASYRFKNLWLSGGVYLGGTGSANQLSDYEEGTWTPNLVGDSTEGAYSSVTRSGTYTKVGRLVTATFYFYGTSGTGSGKLNVTGFPFSAQGAVGVAPLQYNSGPSLPSGTGVPFLLISSSSTTAEIRCNSDTGGGYVEMDYPTTANYVRASVTYETS